MADFNLVEFQKPSEHRCHRYDQVDHQFLSFRQRSDVLGELTGQEKILALCFF